MCAAGNNVVAAGFSIVCDATHLYLKRIAKYEQFFPLCQHLLIKFLCVVYKIISPIRVGSYAQTSEKDLVAYFFFAMLKSCIIFLEKSRAMNNKIREKKRTNATCRAARHLFCKCYLVPGRQLLVVRTRWFIERIPTICMPVRILNFINYGCLFCS